MFTGLSHGSTSILTRITTPAVCKGGSIVFIVQSRYGLEKHQDTISKVKLDQQCLHYLYLRALRHLPDPYHLVAADDAQDTLLPGCYSESGIQVTLRLYLHTIINFGKP